ncbi:MAG TPA: hypothetical protein VHZ53_13115 [Steroidobacteraceae bacterium]|jgi:hypothetical protein|nr:hypothetical protein [Steroidobacteraceae bacterium]
MNLGQFVSVQMIDNQTGKTFTTWVGDVITVRYPDGSTEKFEYLGPGAGTLMFKRVPNSYRKKDGSKPNVSDTTSPPAPGAAIVFNGGPSTAGSIDLTPYLDDTLPRGTVTVGDPIPTNLGTDPNGPVVVDFDTTGWFGDCSC